MRAIDPLEVEQRLPKGWKGRAKSALAAVKKVAASERADAIENRQPIWKDLKPTLAGIHDGKCWYCETRDDRADNAVDHYRPKNRVREKNGGKGGPGYWWLAFEWRNYRFCCSYCNSYRKRVRERAAAGKQATAGKQDHFPVALQWVEDPATPYVELDLDEQPVLLDPLKPADVRLLTFEEDGTAVPARSKKTEPAKHERARESIRIYHLFDERLVTRRREKMAEIRERVEQAQSYERRAGRSAEAEAALNGLLRDLRRSIKREAPFSMAARTELMLLRGRYTIAQDVLDHG